MIKFIEEKTGKDVIREKTEDNTGKEHVNKEKTEEKAGKEEIIKENPETEK